MVRLHLSASRSARANADAGWWRTIALAAIAATCLVPAAPEALAHGFGQRYELPIPLQLFLFGAAAVVALSFLVFGLFVREAHARRARHRYVLFALRSDSIAMPAVLLVIRAAAFALFVIVVFAGLIGDQNPYRNIAPTVVWIIWWVGLAYLQAFLGDLWRLINPWRTAYDTANWLWRRYGAGAELSLGLPYPRWLGVWPACLLLLAFAWIELVSPNAASPFAIACLAIAYSLLTWAGMLVYGRDVWLETGEVFSLFFGTLARFAPTEAKSDRLTLRPLGSGLLDAPPVAASMVAFVVLLLSTVLYDGLIGTGEWAMLESALRPLLPLIGEQGSMLIRSIGLPLIWLLFLAAYLGICALMGALAGGGQRVLEVARTFALTLVPIAIGYHVAHYLVFLLVQGQYIIPLLSDPFGYGWNLVGTAGYRVDIAVVGARFAWYGAVAAIVGGHVVAVYLAHVKATGTFDAPAIALKSQVPLTALMVAYTFIGLSITAEPIVESRAGVEPAMAAGEVVAVPADAVAPSPVDGRLEPVASGGTARVKLTYKVLGSAFHDTTKTSVADLLYAYTFAYRWGVRGKEMEARYDPFIDAATAPLRQHLVAVRPVGVDAGSKSFRVGDVSFVREIFTVEVYLDIAPGDPDWNAVVAPPWSTLPWHVLVLMEQAVERGWAAFSSAEAARRGVPWLDLVRSTEFTAKLASLLTQFQHEAFRPSALLPYVSEEEARRRWTALSKFYKANNHLLVTNGPYKLKSWGGQTVTLEAFRDLTYPLGVGSYDAYAVPRRGFITAIERQENRLVVYGDIEVVEKFQRSYRLVRTSLKSVPAVALRRAAPECRYVLTDKNGRIVLAGAAPLGPGADFQIELAGLQPGRYTMSGQIAVNGNVANASITRFELEVPFRR
jgi:hypothetical protein